MKESTHGVCCRCTLGHRHTQPEQYNRGNEKREKKNERNEKEEEIDPIHTATEWKKKRERESASEQEQRRMGENERVCLNIQAEQSERGKEQDNNTLCECENLSNR